MRGKYPVVGEIQNSSHFSQRKSDKVVPKRSFFDLLVSYPIFEHAGWSHSIRNHKYLVSGMKNGPRAELWAYLR